MQFESLQSRICFFSKSTPDKIAVECGSRRITYAEIEANSSKIAHFLCDKTKENRNICTLMDKSPDLIETLIAVLKCGGVFIPLDPHYPDNRLRLMVEESQADWIVTQGDWLAKLTKIVPDNGKRINVLLRSPNSASFENHDTNMNLFFLDEDTSRDPLSASHEPNQHCYIYFTSGSTGKPKGILGRQRSLLHFIEWEINEFGVDDSFKVSLLTSPSFDPFLRDVFVPLCSGGTLCVPENRELILDARELAGWIDEHEISLIHAVPSLFKHLMNGTRDSTTFRKLKYIFLAGEMLKGNDLKEFFAKFKTRIQLVNLYGPTETTLAKLYYRVKETDANRTRIPVGKPISYTEVAILDKNMRPCQTGSLGEVYIRTPFISSGYYNDPELTRKVFLKNPLTQDPRDLIYKTGDLGKLLPDGNIELVGRIDNQVKVRGFRIELSEVENQLLRHKSIREAVVIDKEDENGDKHLHAYLVSDNELTISEVKQHLAKELPDYMIPSQFIKVERIPLSPNGKVDREALSKLDGSIARGVEHVAARNETEEKLVEIWQDILRVKEIGINDDFFELGGHSLRAATLVYRIHKAFHVNIPLAEIFKTPTIEELAKYVMLSERRSYSPIERAEEREYYPVSPSQRRIFVLDQLGGVSTAYNMPEVMIATGNLDRKRFDSAFRELVRRQESLRTSFALIEGELVQKIHKNTDFEIEYGEADEKEIERVVAAFVKPFDLSKPPLFRVGLVRLSKQKHLWLFDIHHTVSDGMSKGVLVRELGDLYAGKELPKLGVQYKDFCVWLNNLLKTEAFKTQEEYWLQRFSDEIPVLNLPTDYPRPHIQSYQGEVYDFALDNELTSDLKALAVSHGATLFMVLLGVFSVVLSRYSGQEDIVIGTVLAGRTHPDLENLIGVFLNNVALRCRPARGKSFLDYLNEIRDTVLHAHEFQNYPIENLVSKIDVTYDPSTKRLFDVMLLLQNFEVKYGDIKLPRLNLTRYPVGRKTSRCDIMFFLAESGAGMGCRLEYSTSLFKRETMARLSMHFIRVAKDVSKSPEKEISAIEMLTEEEERKVLLEFNDTRFDYPKDKTIIELFEEVVAQAPDSTAVVFEDRSLTYRELNERANQLAHLLRAERVAKPNQVIGLMVGRSERMIVGVLGILKSGAAFVPIDPDYPEDRIEYMAHDAGVEAIVTEPQALVRRRVAGAHPIVVLSDDNVSLASAPSDNPACMNNPTDLVYVIYTSGSTGQPKGVMIEHKNLSYIAWSGRRAYQLDGFPVRLLQMANMSFDVFCADICRAFLPAGTLVICPAETRLDPHALYQLIRKEQITVFESTPALVLPLMEYIHSEKLDVTFLRLLIVGSDTLLIEDYRKLLSRFGRHFRIINSYGTTETAIDSSFYEAPLESLSETGNVPIGKPLGNTQYYILGENRRPVPLGMKGELYIGGGGVGRGYVNLPQLTTERFVDNPFVNGERLYRTGDMCRWLPDGNVEFFGRNDYQVKIRGFRIEVGEVEDLLLQHQAIQEAVVVAKEDRTSGKCLCAYIVSDRELTASEIREYLSQKLPDYMIPSFFMRLEEMPLTPNGKVDRNNLPELDARTGFKTGRTYVAPQSETEKKLAAIWAEVLRVENVGLMDNFFELGGHSLLALELIAKIRSRTDLLCSIADLFTHPTVAALSSCCDQQKAASLQTRGSPTSFGEVEKILNEHPDIREAKVGAREIEDGSTLIEALIQPQNAHLSVPEIFSYLETRIPAKALPHVIHIAEESRGKRAKQKSNALKRTGITQARKEFSFFLAPCDQVVIREYAPAPAQQLILMARGVKHQRQNGLSLRIDKPVDPHLIALILRKLVERHPMLRTVVEKANDDYRLKELEVPDEVNVPFLDLSELDWERKQNLIREVSYAMRKRLFDLSRWPLFRSILVKETLKSYQFIWTISHFVSDAVNLNILHRDFCSVFEDMTNQREFRALSQEESYCNYAGAMRAMASIQDLPEHGKYLISYFKQAHRVKKALLHFKENDKERQKSVAFEQIIFRTGELERLAEKFPDYKLVHIFYAAYARACAQWCSIDNVTIGNIHHGRMYRGGRSYFGVAGDLTDRIFVLVPVNDGDQPALTLQRVKENLEFLQYDRLNYSSLTLQLLQDNKIPLSQINDIPFYFNFVEAMQTQEKENISDYVERIYSQEVPSEIDPLLYGQVWLEIHGRSGQLLANLIATGYKRKAFRHLVELIKREMTNTFNIGIDSGSN